MSLTVEIVMIKTGLPAVILWGIFTTTLLWTASLSANLEVNHLWLSLQVVQKTMSQKESHSDVLH